MLISFLVLVIVFDDLVEEIFKDIVRIMAASINADT